jgi:endonuclease/exonuclease/phosphatase family metal-dependent hydrolase
MRRVSLKTWNCFGATQTALAFLFSKEPPDPHRFEAPDLRARVEAVDILCVQELFVPRAEAFFDRLAHDHKHRVPNGSTLWPLTFGGSGLGIASRFPIVERMSRAYSPPSVSAERFARKGVLHARLSVPGDPPALLDVITTHMQSGYDGAAVAVRSRQVRELRALVDEVGSQDRPMIVCGDLNIDGLKSSRGVGREYDKLKEVLHDFEDIGEIDDRATFHPHPEVNPLAHRFEADGPRQRIDYVFVRHASAVPIRVVRSELALDGPLEGPEHGATFPSDHFAIRVELELDGEVAPRSG